MTWIVGRAGPFGYAVAISDIRVTLSDGSERDCLQKIYNVGPQIAVGFAGSVAIGLKMVHQLGAALHPPSERFAWYPDMVGRDLSIGTRVLFEEAPPEERALGCELLLLGAHPIQNDGDAPWAKCYAFRYRSPDFAPVMAHADEIVSIGSGAGVQPYAAALSRLEKDFDLLKMETLSPGAAGLVLMDSISGLLRRNPQSGISQHVHVCLVGRDGIKLGSNDRTGSTDPTQNFVMPPVARSMEELRALLDGSGAPAPENARC